MTKPQGPAVAPAGDPDRIRVIHFLLNDYVYTRPGEARELLREQAILLRRHAEELAGLEHATGHDYQLSHYLHLANLESQEYRHQAARTPFAAALEIAEARGDVSERLEVYLAYTGHLSNLGQMEAASDYLDRALRLLDSYPGDRFRAHAACRHGYLYLLFFSYPKATMKFLEAETLFEGGTFELTPRDHYFYSLTQSGMGTIYQNSGESDLAIEAFRKAIARCEGIGLRARLPWHQLNVGKELIANGEYESALAYFRTVIDSEANGSTRALAAAYANVGFCYHHLEDHERARGYLDRAEELFRAEPEPDRVELASIGFMRATQLMDAGRWREAVEQLHRTLPEAEVDEQTNDPQRLSMAADAYLYLSLTHAELEDYESAYHYHCTYDRYNRRFHQQVDSLRQQQFAAQFRAEAREQENRQLKLRASQLKLKALRAQMNPHFLYNALNSIQSFISTNDAATATKHLAKFARLMRQSLEYANREYISLEEERKFLSDYLEINRHLRYEGTLTYHLSLHPDLEEDLIGVPTMILQPYVENAIEHGLRGQASGHIEVEFLPEDDDHLLARVTDNGIGRERVREIQARDATRHEHQSRGTQITEDRLRLLSEEDREWVTITDLYDEAGVARGTRVEVHIPITDLLSRRGT